MKRKNYKKECEELQKKIVELETQRSVLLKVVETLQNPKVQEIKFIPYEIPSSKVRPYPWFQDPIICTTTESTITITDDVAFQKPSFGILNVEEINE